jgi:hypothetical protein
MHLLLSGNDAERRRYPASFENADETEQSRWTLDMLTEMRI